MTGQALGKVAEERPLLVGKLETLRVALVDLRNEFIVIANAVDRLSIAPPRAVPEDPKATDRGVMPDTVELRLDDLQMYVNQLGRDVQHMAQRLARLV